MKMFEYTSTAGFNAVVPETLHKMIQRGVSVDGVNGGKLTKTCKFKQVANDARNPAGEVEVRAAERAAKAAAPKAKAPAKKAEAKKPAAKKAVAKKPAVKKVAAKKPAEKKAGVPKVSKYGTHPDGTVQFVPARGIYHGYMGGKIVTVKRDAEKAKADLATRGVTVYTDITFEG